MKTFAGFTEKIPENGDYRPDAMTERECNDKGKKTQQQSSTIHVHDTCITPEGSWSRDASRNCFWDRHWKRAGQLLANIFPCP